MKSYIIFLASVFFLNNGKAQSPYDVYVADVSNPAVNLNGTWKICLTPSEKFWDINQFDKDWKDIQVPGECMMQGCPIEHDKPFVYKKEFEIPADFEKKMIKLRFEGVYSYARIWVNGKYICDHSGGFTAWECDITSSVKSGKTADLTVEVTDRSDEISYASGYAKHPIGGILRNVSLLALPGSYPEQLSIITALDDNDRDAVLTVRGKIRKPGESNRIELELYDVQNKKVDLITASCLVSDTAFQINNLVANPLKWDAEHPNLYRLKVTFVQDGTETWNKYYSFGFREIEIKGNRLLVNGIPVKLRGACRHDIHPLLGRVSTPDYELRDVLLAKEANINFIRTSHYPPTDHFLRLCDEYGIYVEDETAVCFVGTHRSAEYYPGSTESAPDFTGRYLSQLKEMVDNHRNHPSVIIWSIGNENSFGTNFKKSYDMVKSTDPTRPVIFSYPGKVPDDIKSYDMISMHYPGIDGNMEQYGKTAKSFGHPDMPVIFDEWAHVACYDSITVKEDPNIRDFWGMGLDSMWQKTYDADGGLGGAIWGMIDETFMLPEDLPGSGKWRRKIDKNIIHGEYTGKPIGYGEWGIVDTWRRKKPEFWNVQKAYSPVRILKTEYNDVPPGTAIEIPVYNRFDFTNLNELIIKYNFKRTIHTLNSFNIPAHTQGTILLPMDEWPVNEPVLIDFIDRYNRLVDSYTLHRKKENQAQRSIKPAGNIELTENEHQFTICCENNLKIQIDKSTGLFIGFKTPIATVAFSGPHLNLRTRGKEIIYSSHQINNYGTDWKLNTLSVQKKDGYVEVLLTGDYSRIPDVGFITRISPDGSITTEYRISNPPKEYIREIGIKYRMDDGCDSLSWKREPYWSVYPAQHLSGPEGKVSLYTDNLKIYREAPGKDWQYDTKSFFYNGIKNETARQLTHVAKATKENIREYKLQMKGIGSLVVTGIAGEGCRIEQKENKIDLYINNELDYPDLNWGNFQRNILLDERVCGKIEITIHPIKSIVEEIGGRHEKWN